MRLRDHPLLLIHPNNFHGRAVALVFLLINLFVINVAGGGVGAPLPPFHPQKLRQLLYSRCNFRGRNTNANDEGGNAIWVYKGHLVDPLSGKRIVQVEGLELVRHLTEDYHPDKKTPLASPSAASKSKERKRLGDLNVQSLLYPSSIGGKKKGEDLSEEEKKRWDWDYMQTVFSRKLFVYVNPEQQQADALTNKNGNFASSSLPPPRRILQRIRLRAGGKERRVKLEEAVALYDSATTFVSRNNGKDMILHTEFPNSKCILSDCCSTIHDTVEKEEEKGGFDLRTNNDDINHGKRRNKIESFPSDLEFSTFTRLNRDKTHGLGPMSKQSGEDESTTFIPRSKFIQFGPDIANKDKYGARETYSYRNLNPSNSGSISVNHSVFSQWVYKIQSWTKKQQQKIKSSPSAGNDPHSTMTCTYTRYGECPPWYAPGRMCSLELVGERVDSMEHVSPLCASLVSSHVPGFMSVDAPIPYTKNDDVSANNEQEEDDDAMAALKWFREERLQLEEDAPLIFGRYPSPMLGLKNVWNRINAATVLK